MTGLGSDPNAVINAGSPTFTDGINSVSRLWDLLGRKIELDDAKNVYRRGWGPDDLIAARVISVRTLLVQAMNSQPKIWTFDVMNDIWPITIGMEFKMLAMTGNRSKPRKILIKRPSDASERVLQTYLRDEKPLIARMRLLVVPKIRTLNSMMGEK